MSSDNNDKDENGTPATTSSAGMSSLLGYAVSATTSQVPSSTSGSTAAFSVTTASTPASRSQPPSQSGETFEAMRSRIRELEEQLSKRSPSSDPASDPDMVIRLPCLLGGSFYQQPDLRLFGPTTMFTRAVVHKTRMFGQSHWINSLSLYRDMIELMLPHLHNSSRAISLVQQCKALARVIKSRRTPQWPTLLTPDLPPREVADQLVDCYVGTIESIYRIVHIPSFRRDYETVWAPKPDASPPSSLFLVQLKLILALGAVTFDANCSLRASVIQWIYEAQTYLSEPKFKARLGIQALQAHILLLLARELVGVGGDSVWVSAGALLRLAMHMGVHRDPSGLVHAAPKKRSAALFTVEMSRRLWNTVLEVALQASLTSGGSPLLNMGDFDTAPMDNFDDEQFPDGAQLAQDPSLGDAVPRPRPAGEFTDSSVAIALRRAFAPRLAIATYLNSPGSHGRSTYDGTLRLDADLRAAYRELGRSLQRLSSHSSSTGQRAPSQFAMRAVDFIMRRYFLALHAPYFPMALHQTAYAFSRKVVVESALKLWSATDECSDVSGDGDGAEKCDPLQRLTTCATGFFRFTVHHAHLMIEAEAKAQLHEEEGSLTLGRTSVRPDLLMVVETGRRWALRCIEAGDVNVKGYMCVSINVAHIECLIRGTSKEEVSGMLLRAAEQAMEKGLQVLEGMVAEGQNEESRLLGESGARGLGDFGPTDFNMPPVQLDGDWDVMMSDFLFDFGNAEPFGLVFD